jgi:hypothetical protein
MRSVTVCLRQRKVRLGLTMNCLVPVIALVVIFAVACVGGGGGATVVPSPSLSQEVATPMHPTPISPLPEATATSTASPWECFPVGIYEHGICRLPGGGLVLDSFGDILATSEMAYPQCPPSWTAVDGAAACLPAADWSVREVAQGTLRVRSTRGSEVLIAQEPSQMIPEFCDPVYTFGLVIHPGQSDMQWCLHVGQRWAHISVVAEAPSDEYYTAFQIALSAGELSPAP